MGLQQVDNETDLKLLPVNLKKPCIKRGCEITASTEKEDFSFKMNERSSFMLKLTCDENFNYKL